MLFGLGMYCYFLYLAFIGVEFHVPSYSQMSGLSGSCCSVGISLLAVISNYVIVPSAKNQMVDFICVGNLVI